MYILEESKTSGEAIGKFLGAMFLIPYFVMLALGALSIRKNIPQLAWGYWDLVLANIALAFVRGGKVSKWYIKSEK